MSDIPVSVDDYERLARTKMDRAAFDYYAGGSGQERTLAANRSAFDAIQFRPRVLVDVSRIDLATTVLGQQISLPVMLAPTAFNRLACDEGEMAAARAAGASGTVMISSTLSTCTLEDVAKVATGPLWFQLYVYKDRGLTTELIARAEAAGYRALVLTVDTPRLGRRERDVRNRFTLPTGLSMKNLEHCLSDATRWGAHSSFSAYVHDLFDPSLTWRDVDWLRTQTKLPLLLKGVMTAEDTQCSVDSGAHAVVVSNHGGRQLDGVSATVTALPEVIEAAAGRVEIFLDGGVRRGTDVLKALALGARAVLIGRAYLWGLAVAGEDGVRDVLRMLRDELELSMALAGRTSVAAIDSSLIRRPHP
jgi:isopentenyl diphosphate isomerase/L-lactate dehydrogenase-like FMN-dependent dehydrogenase